MNVLYFLVIGLLVDLIQKCLMYFDSFSLGGYTFSFLLRPRFSLDPFQLSNILRTCISCRPTGLDFWCHNSSHTSSWEARYLHEHILEKIVCNWNNKLHHSVRKERSDFLGSNCIFGIEHRLMSLFPSFSLVSVPKNLELSYIKYSPVLNILRYSPILSLISLLCPQTLPRQLVLSKFLSCISWCSSSFNFRRVKLSMVYAIWIWISRNYTKSRFYTIFTYTQSIAFGY